MSASDPDAFEWAVSVDDDNPFAIVTLGSEEVDAGLFVWFILTGDEAQALGGALVRASGELMRRERAAPDPDAIDFDDDDDEPLSLDWTEEAKRGVDRGLAIDVGLPDPDEERALAEGRGQER